MTVFAFAECLSSAGELAAELGLACSPVALRSFPDGESLVRITGATQTAILYRSLDRPNVKLVELLFAASALRDGGAQRVVLVAPYLAYMRQDIAFHPGEAVSQRVLGRFIADHFDGLVTVDPHLHRIARLEQAVPGIPALALSAAPALRSELELEANPVLVGPDAESRPWVEALAKPLGLDFLIGEKRRFGDTEVQLDLPGIEIVAGRPAILVDDVISSGTTIAVAAGLLSRAGAIGIEAVATHGLASAEAISRTKAAGVTRIRTTTTIESDTACISIAAILAEGIRSAGWAA